MNMVQSTVIGKNLKFARYFIEMVSLVLIKVGAFEIRSEKIYADEY